jgi:hypothetical protein
MQNGTFITASSRSTTVSGYALEVGLVNRLRERLVYRLISLGGEHRDDIG